MTYANVYVIFSAFTTPLRAFSFKEHAQAHVREREEHQLPERIAKSLFLI